MLHRRKVAWTTLVDAKQLTLLASTVANINNGGAKVRTVRHVIRFRNGLTERLRIVVKESVGETWFRSLKVRRDRERKEVRYAELN